MANIIKFEFSEQTEPATRKYLRQVIAFIEDTGAGKDVDTGVLELLEDALNTRSECIKVIQRDGMTVLDRYGCAKAHPLLATKEKAHNQVMSALRELGLTVRSRKDLPDIQEATKEKSAVEKYFDGLLSEK